MAWKECVICGYEFFTEHSKQKCCSKECSKASKSEYQRHTRLSHGYKYRPKAVYTCKICAEPFFPFGGKQKTCSPQCSKKHEYLRRKKHRLKNPDIFKERKKMWIDQNPDKVKSQVKRNYENNIGIHVARYYRRQLGTEPPADLVEDATALRLLRRALRD